MPFKYPESTPDGPYRVLDQYHSKPRKLRIASVGAGASGLCLAYKLERQLAERDSWELTIFEKNDDIGGTWYENTYPGVACDIPSHDYNYSWDPKPDWSQFFASGAEIQAYFQDFADRHGSRQYIKLRHKVDECRWDETEGKWHLQLSHRRPDGTVEQVTDWAHVLINGTGILNNWVWPDIDGLHSFSGPLVHSADWDHSVDFAGKSVAVIGTGSTSVQIVPQLQKISKSVSVFMRSPTWISPPFGAGTLESDLRKKDDDSEKHLGQRQYDFTDDDISKFKTDPEYHLHFRKRIEAEINSLFNMYKQGSELSDKFRAVITDEMVRRLGPGFDDLKKFIIPTWAPGCRRISPGDGYLEALVQPNVRPVMRQIKAISTTGIITEDDELHKFDIIVCATGFKVAFRPAFRVINDQGKTVDEDWTDGPNLYMGVSAPRFPNYYTIVGPGATWSNGTLLPSIETTIEYVVQMIAKIQSEVIRSISVRQDALDDLYAHLDEFHKSTVWQESCRSWFKDGKIKNRIYLWPGATIHFLKSIKKPRFEDYQINYIHKNRFAFLGHGLVKAHESGSVTGLSPYVRASDHDWDID